MFLTQNCADRPCRSIGRSIDVHRPVHVCWHSGPVGRSADRIREPYFLYLGGRPCGRPDCPTVIFLTVGGRPGWSTACLSGCQISLTASFLFGLYKPHFLGVLFKIFRANFSPFSGFKNKFSKVFKEQKDPFYLF